MDEQIKRKAIEMRREYYRAWKRNNPEKVKRAADAFWERKAMAALEAEKEAADQSTRGE